MNDSSQPIDIDYDALSRQIAELETLAEGLSPAIEAGRSTQGLDSAHAFGLLCAGMNIPGSLVSGVVTAALGLSKSYLESVARRERSGLNDFRELETQIQDVVKGGVAAIDHVPGRGL